MEWIYAPILGVRAAMNVERSFALVVRLERRLEIQLVIALDA